MKIAHTLGPFEAAISPTRIWKIGETGGAVAIIAEPQCETSQDFKEVGISSKRFDEAMGNAQLVMRCDESPHECSIPECPGNINRLKLEAFDDLLSACKSSSEFISQVIEFLDDCFPEHGLEETSIEELFEQFDDVEGSADGELYRIVAQLKKCIEENENAIAKAEGKNHEQP